MIYLSEFKWCDRTVAIPKKHHTEVNAKLKSAKLCIWNEYATVMLCGGR